MRITKMISNSRCSWMLDKFSLQIPRKCTENSMGNLHTDVLTPCYLSESFLCLLRGFSSSELTCLSFCLAAFSSLSFFRDFRLLSGLSALRERLRPSSLRTENHQNTSQITPPRRLLEFRSWNHIFIIYHFFYSFYILNTFLWSL